MIALLYLEKGHRNSSPFWLDDVCFYQRGRRLWCSHDVGGSQSINPCNWMVWKQKNVPEHDASAWAPQFQTIVLGNARVSTGILLILPIDIMFMITGYCHSVISSTWYIFLLKWVPPNIFFLEAQQLSPAVLPLECSLMTFKQRC